MRFEIFRCIKRAAPPKAAQHQTRHFPLKGDLKNKEGKYKSSCLRDEVHGYQ